MLALTQQLLESIYVHPDPEFYAAHTVPELTAFEGGPRIEGLERHLFALRERREVLEGTRAKGVKVATHLELMNPKVRIYGDTAIVTYTSGIWRRVGDEFDSGFLHETRVWVRRDAQWKLVHLHKSPAGQP